MKNSLNKHKSQELKRIIEYLISGGAFFWSGYLAFFVFDKGLGFSLWWATSLSYLIGWTVNYLLQRYWVFRSPGLKNQAMQVTTRYLIISAVNLLINYIILSGLNNIGVTPYIGQFVSAGFFTVWNYLWYKLWVFVPNSTKSNKIKSK